MDTSQEKNRDEAATDDAVVARLDLLLGKLDSISSSIARIEQTVASPSVSIGSQSEAAVETAHDPSFATLLANNIHAALAADDPTRSRKSENVHGQVHTKAAENQNAAASNGPIRSDASIHAEDSTSPDVSAGLDAVASTEANRNASAAANRSSSLPKRPGLGDQDSLGRHADPSGHTHLGAQVGVSKHSDLSRQADIDRQASGNGDLERKQGASSLDDSIDAREATDRREDSDYPDVPTEQSFAESESFASTPASHARPTSITARYVVETPHDPDVDDSAASAQSANESADFLDESHVGRPAPEYTNSTLHDAIFVRSRNNGGDGSLPETTVRRDDDASSARRATSQDRDEQEISEAKPSLWKRVGGEKQLGRYLLSLAASLLILMAAASLVALLWNAIPHYAKILLIGVIALVMTGFGTRFALRPNSNRVAAATIMGTGGGLGFVAIIGGVLLDNTIPPQIAIILLTAWSITLIVLASKARIFFAALTVGAGGIITVILARTYAHQHSSQAPTAAWAIVFYCVCLAVVCGFVARSETSYKLRAAYAAISFTVTTTGLAAAPYAFAAHISPISSASTLLAALALTLGTYAMTANWAITAWPALSDLLCGGWFAACLITAQVFSFMRSIPLPVGPDDPVILAAVLGVVLAVTLIVSVLPLNARMSAFAGLSTSTTAIFLGMANLFHTADNPSSKNVHPALQLLIVGAVSLSAIPTIKRRSAEHSIIIPTALLLFEFQAPGSLVRELLSLVAVALTVCVVLVISYRSSNRRVLIAASWVLAAAILGAIPIHTWRITDIAGLQDQWQITLHVALTNLILAALIYAGLPTNSLTPIELVTGKGRGKRPEMVRVIMTRNVEFQGRTPAAKPTTVAALPPLYICLALLAYKCFAFFLVYDVANPLAKVIFLATSLALNMALSWMVWPSARSFASSAVLGANTTIGVVGTFLLFGGASSQSSVIGTISFLTAGTVCVIIGFIARGKALRIYGLGLIMVMVLRFAIADMAGQNSLVRIVSLLVAGLVCFGLSLAYAHFTSIFDADDQPEPTDTTKPSDTTKPTDATDQVENTNVDDRSEATNTTDRAKFTDAGRHSDSTDGEGQAASINAGGRAGEKESPNAQG